MIPHPISWQSISELDRRNLLAAAERYHRESIALAAAAAGAGASRTRRGTVRRRAARAIAAFGLHMPLRRPYPLTRLVPRRI